MKTNISSFKFTPWNAGITTASLCVPAPLIAAERVIASFEEAESLESWKSVNDGVMGGVSKGEFKRSDQETLLFSGELSLANNDGFASIRMVPSDLELAGTSGIMIKARGDGRTYWVDLRLANQPAASFYWAYLATTAGEWKETQVPYQDFKLQAFGQDLLSKAINPESINSVGFTIADKMEGDFSLEIASVKAVDNSDPGKEKNENTVVDVAILKSHVISGKITLAKALDAREAASLQGSKVTFQFKDGRILVGSAALLKADIFASNGIIHVIDQVLIPQTKSSETLTPSQLMELAIQRGVPVFNNGDFEGCSAIYEVTVEALRTMESVPKSSRKLLSKALTEARAEKSTQDQAWILRKAIDKTWANLNQSN